MKYSAKRRQQVEGCRGYAPYPLTVPGRLVEALAELGISPVLVGGAAVQVWTGKCEGVFATKDLDFLAPVTVGELASRGFEHDGVGRHLVVDGVAIEFPSGPLAVGDLILAEDEGAVEIPVSPSGVVRCLRPEACALDRLTWVAADRSEAAYNQALAVILVQSESGAWDWEWGANAAKLAGLHGLWVHVCAAAESARRGVFDPRSPVLAASIGWDSRGRR